MLLISNGPNMPGSATEETNHDIRQPPSAQPVIEIDASAKIIDIYLGLVSSSWSLPEDDYTYVCFYDLQQLKRVCQKMQTTKFDHTIDKRMHMRVKSEPWEIFQYASEENDLKSAKAAIANFGEEQTSPPRLFPDIEARAFLRVRTDWVVELLRHRIGAVGYQAGQPTEHASLWFNDWKDVAMDFSPMDHH